MTKNSPGVSFGLSAGLKPVLGRARRSGIFVLKRCDGG
jgi:hypothetical protein